MSLNAHITLVEYDEQVLELAKEHFGLVESEMISVVHADAFTFCQNYPDKFDLILIDLFVDLDIPQELSEATFWKNLQRLAAPSAQVLLNTIAHNEQSKVQVNEIRELLRSVSANVDEIVLQEMNHMFIVHLD